MPPDLLVLALLALTLLVVSATSLVGSVVFDPDAASGVAVSDVPVASGAAAGFDSCFFLRLVGLKRQECLAASPECSNCLS
jgi:hypothetical protein